MPSLPAINTGSIAIFPVVRIPSSSTKIAQFEDGSEQRWLDRSTLYSFELTYDTISRIDKNNLDAFIASVLGPATPWTFNWQGRGAASSTAGPQNGNFETSLSGWTFSTDGSGWVAYTNSVSYDGTNAAVIQTNATVAAANSITVGRLQSSTTGIETGQAVTISVWVATNPTGAPNPSGVTSGAQFRINCYNSGGTLLSQVDPGVIIPSGTGWQQINLNLSTPPGTASVALILLGYIQNLTASAYTGTCTVIFDNVSITSTNSTALYPNCVFDDDSFTWTENQEGQWSGKIRFHQIAKGGLPPAARYASFPSLGPGVATGFPFSSKTQFSTRMCDLPAGNRIAYPTWGAGLAGRPTRPLKRWTCTLSTMTEADVLTLESHFVAAGGRYHYFAFTDPETRKFYSRVRYDMDQLKITHIDYGISTATVELVEIFGPGWTA